MRNDSSPGRVGPKADWVYYDPVARRLIGEVEARRLAARERNPIPEGLPVGSNFDVSPDGWVGVLVAGERNDNGNYGNVTGVGTWENDADVEESKHFLAVRYEAPFVEPPAPVVVVRPSTPVVAVGEHTSNSDADVIRQFLREVGVDERHLSGSWVELRGYVCGRFS